jgi:hypothetical protein
MRGIPLQAKREHNGGVGKLEEIINKRAVIVLECARPRAEWPEPLKGARGEKRDSGLCFPPCRWK